MERVTEYRGFDIHTELRSISKDMFDVWYQLGVSTLDTGAEAATLGTQVRVQGGPFTRRWAYLVAELSGRAAVDVALGVDGFRSHPI